MLCPIDIFDERYLNSAGRVEMYVVEQHVEYLDNSFGDTFRMTKRSFEALLRLLATQRNKDFWSHTTGRARANPMYHQMVITLLSLDIQRHMMIEGGTLTCQRGPFWGKMVLCLYVFAGKCYSPERVNN